MTSPAGVPLDSIPGAFEGTIPATIATCSQDGTPNVSYLSIVRRVDNERIAVTNQFLSKTVRNLRVNPQVCVRVVDLTDMAQYDIEGRFVVAQTSGELFESVRIQLDAVAAQTGMAGTFRLRSVDMISVDRCTRVDEPRPSRSTIEAEGSVLNPLGTFTGRLASCRDLSEATLTCLELLDDLFGFAHSMLLIADNENQQLFAVATHGYDAANVGAEIAMGEGFIGVAAQRREMVRITSMARNRAMAAAVSRDEAQGLPLRGLDDAQSVLAAPVMLGDRLVGVLYLDSSVPGTFDSRQAELIDIIARHLALTIAFLESDGPDDLAEGITTSTLSGDSPTSSPASPTPDTVRVSFHERDGSLFIDSDYLIRGVAGRILYRLLAEHAESGRTQFSNKELRLDRSLGLPAGADNLEARLLVLRRRLSERGGPIGLERVGRGRLELTVACPIDLGLHPDTTS